MNIWKTKLIKQGAPTAKVVHAAVISAHDVAEIESMTQRAVHLGCTHIALWPHGGVELEDRVDNALEDLGLTHVITTSHADESEEDFASYLRFGIDPEAQEMQVYFLSFAEPQLARLFAFLPGVVAPTVIQSTG